MAIWVLIHSPLVGAATWAPVAAELHRQGQHVVVPDLSPALSTTVDHASRQAELVASAVRRGPVVLVAHSGAGPLLPLIADRLLQQRISVAASVFVDAGLPHPGQSRIEVLPAPAVGQLQEMAVDGWLPPWTSWWSPEQLLAILPDERVRNRLIETCPRLPSSLFSELLPNLDEKQLGICSYVRLSSAYDDVAARAEGAGWPVRRIDAHHLAIVTAPQQIAEAVLALVKPAGD